MFTMTTTQDPQTKDIQEMIKVEHSIQNEMIPNNIFTNIIYLLYKCINMLVICVSLISFTRLLSFKLIFFLILQLMCDLNFFMIYVNTIRKKE